MKPIINACTKPAIILVFALLSTFVQSQIVQSGRIEFERKTNLLKRFKGSPMEGRLRDHPTQLDYFNLYFNDTASVFKAKEGTTDDEYAWTTSKNTVYEFSKSGNKLSILDMWGTKIYLTDTLSPRTWKITESTRNIAGYNCRKAVWNKDDSTRIYAWYTDAIAPTVGPEGFNGLPGAILGLATEDGGIIYFAKEVEVMAVDDKVFAFEMPKKDVYTKESLRAKIMDQMKGSPWAERIVGDLMRWL